MKWTLCHYPSPALCRDQDNAIIRPLPRVKRLITDNTCLPHIVQVNISTPIHLIAVQYSAV